MYATDVCSWRNVESIEHEFAEPRRLSMQQRPTATIRRARLTSLSQGATTQDGFTRTVLGANVKIRDKGTVNRNGRRLVIRGRKAAQPTPSAFLIVVYVCTQP